MAQNVKETISILNYPHSQEAAVWGMRDILTYARECALEEGGSFPQVEISASPPGRAVAIVLPPTLSTCPPLLPPGWSVRLRDLHGSGALIASVCSGVLLAAGSGLLDGRTVTAHWSQAQQFRNSFPNVILDLDSSVVDQGDVITASGVVAWTDLALHLVGRFGDRNLMLAVAKAFVLKPVSRVQDRSVIFIPNLMHRDESIRKIQIGLAAKPSEAHSIKKLAEAAAMSERTFCRRFRDATGISPGAYIQHLRVEAARSLLESTRRNVEQISLELGYADTASLRRVFRRIVGLSPSEYRRKFGSHG